MPLRSDVPDALLAGVFTTAEARDRGISRQVLRGDRFVQMHRGVFRPAAVEPTLPIRIAAARRVLPDDAALSHTTALWWHGVELRAPEHLHFSTNTDSKTKLDGVVLHRRIGRLNSGLVHGVPTLGPDRSFVDSATLLGHVDLVRAGDWLVRLDLTDPDRLARYVLDRHLDGVVRARRATPQVRAGVDSVRETDVRLMLVHARLPVPDVNRQILDDHGAFLARGDLVYPKLKVLVEYDGWHHERDAQQRQKDHLRRERLERAGWRVIVVTAADLRQPITIVSRVFDALVIAGYEGTPPVISLVWRRWFGA